jgi:hypothetical protein
MEGKRITITASPIICVADVDTRLACSTFCAGCAHYVRERRRGQRRRSPRESHDRRVMLRV